MSQGGLLITGSWSRRSSSQMIFFFLGMTSKSLIHEHREDDST
jgi:hypothetical protein